MKYAVIKTGGKQYRVSEGDIVEVDKLPQEKKSSIEFDQTLLYVSDGQVKVGKPVLKDLTVKGKVLDQIKGEKIRVAKFKAKSRYRRVTGFRAKLTQVQIEKIGEGRADVLDSEKSKLVRTKKVGSKSRKV